MYLIELKCFFIVTFQYMTCASCLECDRNKCCPNYFEVNGVCTECPAGTFGLNCTGKCATNFYGQFCEKQCHCPYYQYCDPVHGCQNNSHTTNGDNIPCVQNYYNLNGHCTECPNGTFSVNCSETCPKNYFGLFCKELCSCSTDQYCDPIKGCLHSYNASKNDSTIQEKPTSKWKSIPFALSGGFLTLLVATGVFCFRSRLKTIKEHWSFSHTAENQGEDSLADQDIEVANLGNPTHSTQGHCSEERREVSSNVYDDLRSSQMIDRNSVSVNVASHFVACSEETLSEDTFDTNYGRVLKRHYLNSYTESNGEEDLANNYEHVRMSTEYSVLSLKRNIDPSITEWHGHRDRCKDGDYDLLVGQFHNISESSENSQSESESETCLSLTKAQK